MIKIIRKKGKVIGYKARNNSKIYKINVYGIEQSKALAEVQDEKGI